MSDPQKTAIIVEDEFIIALDLQNGCERLGVSVLGTAGNEEHALELFERHPAEYVLMDVRLQGKRDGVDIANAIHRTRPGTKIIFITGSNEPPTLDRINDDDPHRVLIKPISRSDLKEAFGL